MLRRHFGALPSAGRLLADPKAGGRSPPGHRKSVWSGHTQAADCIQVSDLRTGERVSRQQLRYPGPRRFPQRCGREAGDDIVGHPVRHQRRRTGLGAVQMNWKASGRGPSSAGRGARTPASSSQAPNIRISCQPRPRAGARFRAKPAPREGNIDHSYCMERPARRAGRITATAGHRSRPLALGEGSGRPHSPLTPGLGRRRRHRAACTSIRGIPPPLSAFIGFQDAQPTGPDVPSQRGEARLSVPAVRTTARGSSDCPTCTSLSATRVGRCTATGRSSDLPRLQQTSTIENG